MVKEYQAPASSHAFSLDEQVDCIDERGVWLNAEIKELSPDQVKVHYSGFHRKFDRWVPKGSTYVLKQWRLGQPFQLNNRIDVLDSYNKWLEARVIDLNDNQVKIRYRGYHSKYDEWLNLGSQRIKEVGSKSAAYGIGRIDPDASVRYGKRQIQPFIQTAKPREQREEYFSTQLQLVNFTIYEVEGDGNCLFRAVAHQLYGCTSFHSLIRHKVVDYVQSEREYFMQFITGEFEDYVAHQRQNGAWGDDVEIQAMSEIYNRPFEVYAYSNRPMRTFHESTGSGLPLRLAYHGQSHYDSIVKSTGHVPLLAGNTPGVVEDAAIERVRNRNYSPELLQSRDLFDHAGQVDLDEALQASLNEFEENERNRAIQQVEQLEPEEQIVQQVIEESKRPFEDIDTAIMESLTGGGMPESVQFVMQAGFTEEQAMQAWTIIGDDPQAMLDFLLNDGF